MTKVKVLGRTGSPRVKCAWLCLSSGIVKFKNENNVNEFLHVSALAGEGCKVIELNDEELAELEPKQDVSAIPPAEELALTPDEPKFIEEKAEEPELQKVEVKKSKEKVKGKLNK